MTLSQHYASVCWSLIDISLLLSNMQCTIIRTTELAAAHEKLAELERQKEETLKSYSPASLLQKLHGRCMNAFTWYQENDDCDINVIPPILCIRCGKCICTFLYRQLLIYNTPGS